MKTLFLLMCYVPLFVDSILDCSALDLSCETCLRAYPKCVWCESHGNGRCISYFRDEVCDNGNKCPTKNQATGVDHYSNLVGILNTLKSQDQNDQQRSLSDDSIPSSEETASSTELKDLLHKLLLLKLLRKVKNKGSASLSFADRELLSEYTNSLMPSTTTTTTTTTTPIPENNADVNLELTKLLALLKSETDKNAKQVLSNYLNPTTSKIFLKSTTTARTQTTSITTKSQKPVIPSIAITTNISVDNHIESGGVNYEEEEKDLFRVKQLVQTITKSTQKTTSTKVPSMSSTSSLHSTKTKNYTYCNLYEGSEICNRDNNCTWCNTMENCIARNHLDYNKCVKKKRLDNKFGLDQCLSYKHCKSCVGDRKCYWCESSKSCHTYPFFGYIPDTCTSGFFVKQCDVQLAVIIVVLPLIIILLAMVTFYFCLKYCYYRRKVLRVPLFEKPGVFDYRKDKKVYFVNPEDEDDSQDEMQVETFRKKYRLPADKTPLIDPNS